jgi:hypothetical protein
MGKKTVSKNFPSLATYFPNSLLVHITLQFVCCDFENLVIVSPPSPPNKKKTSKISRN